VVPVAPPPTPAAPTADDARAFMDGVEKDLRRLWVLRDMAGWTAQNFINGDTQALSASGEEATAEYIGRAIVASHKFDKLALPPELARKFTLLRLAQTVPAPTDPGERADLAKIEAELTAMFGEGQYCKTVKGAKKCLTIDELSKILRTSRNYDELADAWTGWHAIGKPMRDKYTRYVELGNKGAKDIGFADLGALWRSGYDMKPEEFEADIERLWGEVKPLYDELHCYVRMKLRAKYGKDKVPEHAPIPAHLLGNMWAQEWGNVYPLVEPYAGQASLDASKKIEAIDKEPLVRAKKMVELGQDFFVSLGFDKLPPTFWERSLFLRPKDRQVVCHASAWDVTWSNDLRIKMCIEPTEGDLVTIHHELGHDFYFQSYTKLPILFQAGANDGFHEGIGDTLALSVTPAYLKQKGLLDQVPDPAKNKNARTNALMKMALDKIAFLPFGLLIDKWRWDVFAGKTPKDKYNAAWWQLRAKYQGVTPPSARTEADFDPGAKFHVPASTPYIRYFLARIYQFQFHRALCKIAGQTPGVPLDACSIYGNKAAGEKLRAMLAMGASRPWPEELAVLSGETKADASALVEYFAPLREFLKDQTKGEKCGW
jgi:peptidyl-dipeptidase A